MPETEVLYYQEADGYSPVMEWLRQLFIRDPVAFQRCEAALTQLAHSGHELRRPVAAMLQNGIYELRPRLRHVNYRLLYFFHGRSVAVLAHALTKEDVVPPADIERALRRKRLFEADPEAHTHED